MDIQGKVLTILKSNEADALANVGIAGTAIFKPEAAALMTVAHEAMHIVDEVRIKALLKGMSTGFNQEKHINQLYSFVEKSEENALYLVNTLRKALLTDSLIACTIMGKMLSLHMDNKRAFDQDDNIIFRALENATDDDIRIFYRVMNEYLTKNEDGHDIFSIPNIVINNPGFSSALDWCVFNRIFNGTSGVRWIVDGQDYDVSYSPTSAGHRLREYVYSVRQVLNY